MPLITLTVRRPKSPEFKTAVLDAVHEALKFVGVPSTDRFQRVLELDDTGFRYDESYPDAQRPRSEDFALIEVLWSVGRSVKVKRQFLRALMEQLSAKGFDPENVMAVGQ